MRYGWRRCVWVIVVAAVGLPVSTTIAQPEAAAADAGLMQPTQQSLRLTPVLARAFGRFYVAEELEHSADMSQEQAAQLGELLARRSRRLVSEGGTDLRDACEGCLAMTLADDGRFGPETSRVFGQRMQPVLRVMHGFLDGVAEDSRRVLSPEQYAELERKLRRDYHDLGRLENKMRRWADGGFKEGESPQVDHFGPEDGPPLEADPMEQTRHHIRWSRRWAEYEVNEIGPAGWARFVVNAKRTFEFDDEQAARADAILAEYREKAEAIMTPEWRAAMLTNRLRRRAYDFDYNQPTDPLRWRWDREYRNACEPVNTLGRALRKAILELPTDAQRQAVMTDLERRAARHGWATEQPADAKLFGLAP
ncbi:MAG: hypothetical protein JXA69_09050 [Phycisphaerae bacterium]|nr:hypothetical protein [Phycisphaerae bacterium]